MFETTDTDSSGVAEDPDIDDWYPGGAGPILAPEDSPTSFGSDDLRLEGTRICDPEDGDLSSTVLVVRDCLEPLA